MRKCGVPMFERLHGLFPNGSPTYRTCTRRTSTPQRQLNGVAVWLIKASGSYDVELHTMALNQRPSRATKAEQTHCVLHPSIFNHLARMSFPGSQVRVERDAINITRKDQYNAGRDQYNNIFNFDDTTEIISFLGEKAATNAFLDAEKRFPPPNCHVGTRTRILAEMSGWVEDGSEPTRVFWLHGTAGIGKSAIAQTLAEKYAGTRLAAAFFFSRNDSTRDSLAPFVASIVYQFSKLHQLWSVLGPTIINTIRLDPKIFESTIENQFQKLIVEPCSQTVWQQDLPNVIVIDGLDECLRSSLDSPTTSTQKAIQSHPPHERPHERLLALIRNVATAYTPIPWIFLVFSRPEPQIRHAFTHKDFGMILTQLAVTSSPEARRDIRKYLVDKFIELREKHYQALRYEEASWPGDYSIDRLADRADGQFIFAVTVTKYIDNCDLEMPQDQLETIFRIYVDRDSNSPYSDLDLLYHEILSHCQERWEKVQPVLRLLATPHYDFRYSGYSVHWRSSSMIALLLNLRKGEVGVVLSRLHAVLNIPGDDDSDIHIAHASFNEFLSDKHRSADYHTPPMSQQEYHNLTATCLLHNLSTLSSHYPPSHPQCNFVATLQSWKGMLQGNIMKYSCQCWDAHCVEIETPSPDLLAALNKFDPYCAMAARIEGGVLIGFFDFDKVVNWARSFGRATHDFVRTCESFLQGVCIGFVPGISRRDAFWFTFELEGLFWNLEQMNGFKVMLLQQLYATGAGQSLFKFPFFTTLLISPTDTSSHTRLPIVTKINAKVFSAIRDSLWHNVKGQALLLIDIQNDTWRTVSQSLVKEDDLIHLKQLLKERRELFFPEYDDWPRTPFPEKCSFTSCTGDPDSFSALRSTNLSPPVAIQDHNVELSLPNFAPQFALPMPTRSKPLPLSRENHGDSEVSVEGNKRKLAPSDEESNRDAKYKRTRT